MRVDFGGIFGSASLIAGFLADLSHTDSNLPPSPSPPPPPYLFVFFCFVFLFLCITSTSFLTPFHLRTLTPHRWWRDKAILIVMFAITGSAALFIVRFTLRHGLSIPEADLFSENWHRAVYFLLMTPCYSCCLLIVGTAMGRHAYALNMIRRIIGRFNPKRYLNRNKPTVTSNPTNTPPSTGK